MQYSKCDLTNDRYSCNMISQILYTVSLLMKASMPSVIFTTLSTSFDTFMELYTCTPKTLCTTTFPKALPGTCIMICTKVLWIKFQASRFLGNKNKAFTILFSHVGWHDIQTICRLSFTGIRQPMTILFTTHLGTRRYFRWKKINGCDKVINDRHHFQCTSMKTCICFSFTNACIKLVISGTKIIVTISMLNCYSTMDFQSWTVLANE